MGSADRARNEAQNLAGKAKQAVGRAVNDKPLENRGKRDQWTSQVKKAGDRIKTVFKR